jgi:hypothetical protein
MFVFFMAIRGILRPVCDHGFVTVISAMCHDIVLSDLKAEFSKLTTIVSTPTCTTTRSTQAGPEALANRSLPISTRTYPFFRSGMGGFCFVNIAPVGAYSTKGGGYPVRRADFFLVVR